MYILFTIILTASGSITTASTEFSNFAACNAAKQTIEANMPAQVNYSNYRSLTCVAK